MILCCGVDGGIILILMDSVVRSFGDGIDGDLIGSVVRDSTAR